MEERRAHRVAELFRERDEASVREMAKPPDDDADYVSIARKHVENLERALQPALEMRVTNGSSAS